MKRWEICPKINEEIKNKFPEINPIVLQLLYNRGLKTQKEIDEFLLPDYSQDIADPFIFLEMQKAVDRIYQAINNKEKILIYGDYDADGVSSTFVLYEILKKLGARIETYLPDRELEGYGLNKEAIKNFVEKKINLIITCDCGIANAEEVDLANRGGVETIITDHHLEPKILPKALAIINPHLKREKYPFEDLAGVGVAFKLIQALLQSEKCVLEDKEASEKWLLDLVALGTIADAMPLLKENRTLCKYGLLVLNKTRNQGLKALIEKSGLKGVLDTQNIYYQLGPRLNVAGRIDHANESLKLLLAEGDEAHSLASKINALNEKRQKMVEDLFTEIKREVGEEPKKHFLIVFKEKSPVGILGLLSQKLVENYARPAVVMTKTEKGDLKASGRSIECFDLYAALSSFSDYFTNFGGHRGAAGFTLKRFEDFEKFKEEMEQLAEKEIKDKDLRQKIEIETEVNLSDINWDLQEELLRFEPFGHGNQKPLFLLSSINLRNIEIVGQNGRHRRLVIEDGRKMIYFNSDKEVAGLKIGDKIDVVFELGVNQWNGQQSLEMKVIDAKRSM